MYFPEYFGEDKKKEKTAKFFKKVVDIPLCI
jgi:hypothetical protein